MILPIVFSVLAFFGIVLALVPGIPAVFYLLVISVLFGSINGFELLDPTELSMLAGVYVISFLIDFFSGVLAAKYGGASLRSIAFGIVGAALGTILIPPFGGILGFFVAILFSEFLQKGGHAKLKALRAATYGALGAVLGLAINIVLAILFFSLCITFVFFVN